MATSIPSTIPHPYDKDDSLSRAYKLGWNHGHGIACHNVPTIGDRVDRCVDYVGVGRFVTAENVREYHELLCHAAADNSRDFSPFEFTAHAFNNPAEFTGLAEEDCEGVSEELWEAFEAGTADAIGADLSEYTDEDYGTEEEEDEEA
jgi:hypothetical protein